MLNFEEWLSGVRSPVESVHIYKRPDLIAELGKLRDLKERVLVLGEHELRCLRSETFQHVCEVTNGVATTCQITSPELRNSSLHQHLVVHFERR